MPDDKRTEMESLLNDEDTGLWRRVMKSVRPFGDNHTTDVLDDEREHTQDTVSFADLLAEDDGRSISSVIIPPKERVVKTERSKLSPKKTAKDIRDMGDDVDRRTFDRLKQGKLPISASLDLHGMTQDMAHNAVKNFIHRHYDLKQRLVLIVTGKGRFSPFGVGVLKKNLPNWLKDPDIKPMILKIVQARQKDGGGGAFYVYLRRNRS